MERSTRSLVVVGLAALFVARMGLVSTAPAAATERSDAGPVTVAESDRGGTTSEPEAGVAEDPPREESRGAKSPPRPEPQHDRTDGPTADIDQGVDDSGPRRIFDVATHEFGRGLRQYRSSDLLRLQEAENEWTGEDLEEAWNEAVGAADNALAAAQDAYDAFTGDEASEEYKKLTKKLNDAKELVETLQDLGKAFGLEGELTDEERKELFEKYEWKLAKKILTALEVPSWALKALEAGWALGSPIGGFIADKLETVILNKEAREAAMTYLATNGSNATDIYFESQGYSFYRDHQRNFYLMKWEPDWLYSVTFGILGTKTPKWVEVEWK